MLATLFDGFSLSQLGDASTTLVEIPVIDGERRWGVRHTQRLARVAQRLRHKGRKLGCPARARSVLNECGDVADGDVREADAGGRAVVGRAPTPTAR